MINERARSRNEILNYSSFDRYSLMRTISYDRSLTQSLARTSLSLNENFYIIVYEI